LNISPLVTDNFYHQGPFIQVPSSPPKTVSHLGHKPFHLNSHTNGMFAAPNNFSLTPVSHKNNQIKLLSGGLGFVNIAENSPIQQIVNNMSRIPRFQNPAAQQHIYAANTQQFIAGQFNANGTIYLSNNGASLSPHKNSNQTDALKRSLSSGAIANTFGLPLTLDNSVSHHRVSNHHLGSVLVHSSIPQNPLFLPYGQSSVGSVATVPGSFLSGKNSQVINNMEGVQKRLSGN
jgi:hypothetical protein